MPKSKPSYIDRGEQQQPPPKVSQSTRMCDYVSDWSFFSTEDGQPWAWPPGGEFVFPFYSPFLRHYLTDRFLRQYYGPPAAAALRKTLEAQEAKTRTFFRDLPVPALRIGTKPSPFTISVNAGAGKGWQISDAGVVIGHDCLSVQGRGASP
jgi:hypothetical protein